MLPSLPVLLPFATGILLLLLRGQPSVRRAVALGSLVIQILVAGWLLAATYSSGVLVSHMGNWKVPLGITLVGDKTAAILVMLALIVTLTATLTGLSEQRAATENPMRQPLVQFLLTGIQLSFLTGDLFNLFVAFEVMLLSSYALLTLEAEEGKIRHAYPYVVINLVASALFLAGCGYAYALFGTLNFAGIAEVAAELNQTADGAFRVSLLASLLAFVFSVKAGMFPLYYWLPNSYPVLPPSLGALYSGLLTKVGLYVLLRLLGTVMPPTQDFLYLIIAWLGGATMFFGVLGAISRSGIREILAFHVLSQVGFMILAIGFYTPVAFAATIFYMVHHIIVKASLFLTTSGVISLLGTDHLKRTGGLWKSHPWLGLSFLFFAFSLAGLPPLSGFWAKLWILMEGLHLGFYFLVAVSLVASVLTLASMLKIWFGAFWQPLPEGSEVTPGGRVPGPLVLALLLMTVVSAGVVIGVRPLWEASHLAALELMNPALYIEPVLNAVSKP